jgi:hypothetical protein
VPKSGPWKKVRASQVPQGTLPLAHEPATEDNVQNNLQWVTDRPGMARFNLPGQEFDVMTRGVMFTKPGRYKLTGFSSDPAKSESNTITIEVE